MKISVILPIYNGERTLERTLNSLIDQDYKEFELVACIDGTTDSSLEILKGYEKKFKSCKILINENNLGLGPTLNRLVTHASGEYLAMAEQDDWYYPNRLSLQLDCLEKMHDVGIVSGIAEFYNGKQITAHFPGWLVNGKQYPEGREMFLLNYREQIKVVNSCMMIRKSMHIENGLYFTKHYPSISVDWTYVLRASLKTKLYGLNQNLVRIDRSVDRNSVTSNKNKQFSATRELIRSIAYEYPHIISKKDRQYALNTQRLLEWGSQYGFLFYLKGFYYCIRHGYDSRFRQKLFVRFNKKKG